MTELSIIIPCYDEEKNIPILIDRFNHVRKNISVELILVDNGSSDNTNAVIRDFSKKNKQIKLVHVEKNIGYGNGIWQGLKKATGEFLSWTHADLQTDLKDVFIAFKKIKNRKNPQKCFVVGKRMKRPIADAFFTFGMSIFESMVLGTFMYDINAQPKLFHKNFLSKIKKPPMKFSFDLFLYYMAKKMDYKILRIPVYFTNRIHGVSHWNINIFSKFKFIKNTIKDTIKIRSNH